MVNHYGRLGDANWLDVRAGRRGCGGCGGRRRVREWAESWRRSPAEGAALGVAEV